MAYIRINEIDMTKISTSNTLDVQTIVLVPGVATRGTAFVPSLTLNSIEEDPTVYGVLCSNSQEFLDTWGDKPPVCAPMAWLYAYGLVKAGLPVYFVRIGDVQPDAAIYSVPAWVDPGDGSTPPAMPIKTLEIQSIEPGTEGNRLTVQIRLSYGRQATSSSINATVSIYKADKEGSSNKGTRSQSLMITIPKSSLASENYTGGIPGPNSFEAVLAKNLEELTTKYVDVLEAEFNFTSIFPAAIDPTTPDTNDTILGRLDAIATYLTTNGNFSLSGGTDGIEAAANSSVEGDYGLGSPETIQAIEGILSSPEFYDRLSDKYKYDYSIVTSGGYASKAIDLRMKTLCEKRGDCHAICEPPFGTSSVGTENYFDDDQYDTSYLAGWAPWATTYSPLDSSTEMWMPPGYHHLTALGSALKNYPVWYAQAGVKRGTLPNLIKPQYEIGETLQDRWQNYSLGINPIMKLRKYGYVIYGQRTLLKSPRNNVRSAFESLNVRMLSSVIKKYIFQICLGLSFDQNTRRLWNEFKAELDPILLNMKRNEGIDDYTIIMDERTVTPRAQAELRVPGYVIVSPIRAAERFEINFVLTQVGAQFYMVNGELQFDPTYASSSTNEIQPLGLED